MSVAQKHGDAMHADTQPGNFDLPFLFCQRRLKIYNMHPASSTLFTPNWTAGLFFQPTADQAGSPRLLQTRTLKLRQRIAT